MVMDYLRTAYVTRMKLWQDSDETVEVRWFRAEPGAKLFTGRHRFHSLTWSESKKPEFQRANDGVGEQTAAGRGYDRGANLSGYDGQRSCGSPAAWEHGGVHGVDPPLALDGSDRPACCRGVWQATGGEAQGGGRGPNSAVLLATGGQLEGAAALAVPGVVLLATGGQLEGAAATAGGGARVRASGGQVEGGAARFWSFPWTGLGGEGQGGGARLIPSVWQGLGGEQEGGAASQHGMPYSGQGGQFEGGAALFLTSLFRSLGGEVAGGSGRLTSAHFAVGGGQAQGGAALMGAGFPQTSRGGQQQGGAATQTVRALQTSTGGQAQGGTSATSAAVVQTSAGGQAEGGSTTFTDQDMITGTVFAWAGSGAIPAGFLLCDGSPVSRFTYSALFAAVGNTYGDGDHITTFNVPDLRGRLPIGAGSGADFNAGAVGNRGGSASVALSAANLPQHTHDVPGGTRTSSVTGNAGRFERADPSQGGADLVTSSAGLSSPFSTINPYLSLSYLIKT